MDRSDVMIKGEAKSDAESAGKDGHRDAPNDVLVPARGIAYGVLGGALVWVVLLISF